MKRPKNVLVEEFVKNSLSDEDNLIYEKAMDITSRNIAIGFHKWVQENYKSLEGGVYIRRYTPDHIRYCIEDLYDIFITQS